jgi:hypothetical protein
MNVVQLNSQWRKISIGFFKPSAVFSEPSSETQRGGSIEQNFTGQSILVPVEATESTLTQIIDANTNL